MATNKFLDGGGLTYLWSKFKSFLTTWKTENFGTGTYGISNGLIRTFAGGMECISHNSEGKTWASSKVASYSYARFENGAASPSSTAFFVGRLNSPKSMSIYSDTTYDIKYLIIGTNGIKSGTILHTTESTPTTINNVGDAYSPFICVLSCTS